MHTYAPIEVSELESLLAGSSWQPTQIFHATPDFLADNPDLDEEEYEYLLSLSAAQAALDGKKRALVIAADSENFEELVFKDIQCVFLCSHSAEDSEIELAWFGPTEISSQLDEWKTL